jgi:hypothetical protein
MKYSEEEIRLLAELEVQKDIKRKHIVDNRLMYFGNYDPELDKDYPDLKLRGPNPLQQEILDAWMDENYKVFTFTGGNRLGKCVCFQALTDTPNGKIPVGELYEKGEPFDVYAWDGEKKVVARASAPFKKEGLHECYRIEMSDGSIIECADKHRVLMSNGSYVFVEELAKYFFFLEKTNWDNAPSIHEQDACHLYQIESGSQQYYFYSHRQYDEQLQTLLDISLISSPLQGDVQPYNLHLYDLGESEYKHTNSHQQGFFHLSILDDLLRDVAQFFESLFHSFYKSWKLFGFGIQSVLQSISKFFRQQPIDESSQQANRASHTYCNHDYSYVSPLYTDGNHIISITPIGKQEVYDFTVPKYHNYCAGGLVHHNTFILTVVLLSVLFGKWLWSGVEIPFTHKRPRKVRLVGQDWEKHIKSVTIPALLMLWPKERPVITKKNNQGVEALWTDKITGSTLEIMSNSQESRLHEGWDGDVVGYDEPPKRDIRVANARGLVDREGREIFTMTLISEAWVHREVVKAIDADGKPERTGFHVNGESSVNVGFGLTQKGIDQFAKTLRPEEIEARLRGKPAYLSGLIFPKFERRIHVKDRFPIPLDWIVDIAIDWHPSKAWHILFVATDNLNRKWIIDEIIEKNNYKYIGEEIARRVWKAKLRVDEDILMDPLAKSGSQSDIEEKTVYDKLDEVLWQHSLGLTTASKDQNAGIELVNEYLITETEEPALFVFDDCVTSIKHIEDWMWEDGKPAKDGEDMCENLYRIMLRDTQYSPITFNKSESKPTNWRSV